MGLEAWTSEGRFAVFSREGLLYSQGNACCIVKSERHSFSTTPYGIGTLDFREKVCCIVKGRFAV